MSISEEVSEDLPIESEIEEDIELSYSKKIISEYITQNLQSGTYDAYNKFIEKKVKKLKREAKLIKICEEGEKQHQWKAKKQGYLDVINKLSKRDINQAEKVDEFYRLPVDDCLVNKLKYNNAIECIKEDANFSKLREENIEFQESNKKIELEKFISRQFFKLASKV